MRMTKNNLIWSKMQKTVSRRIQFNVSHIGYRNFEILDYLWFNCGIHDVLHFILTIGIFCIPQRNFFGPIVVDMKIDRQNWICYRIFQLAIFVKYVCWFFIFCFVNNYDVTTKNQFAISVLRYIQLN